MAVMATVLVARQHGSGDRLRSRRANGYIVSTSNESRTTRGQTGHGTQRDQMTIRCDDEAGDRLRATVQVVQEASTTTDRHVQRSGTVASHAGAAVLIEPRQLAV